MLPVIEHAAVHVPGVPTAPHQPRRLFRVGPPTPMTPMPLDRDVLAPLQPPGPPPIPPILAGERVPAARAPPPFPRPPCRLLPQPLEERLAPLDNVHGLCHPG